MGSVLISLNVLIPISLVVAILVVLLWILYTKNKYLYEKFISSRKRFALYKKHIEVLKNAAEYSISDFERFNKVVKAFFKEYHDLDYHLTYLEMADYFMKKGRQNYAQFCELMSNVNYSGEKKINTAEVKRMVYLFSEIINKY